MTKAMKIMHHKIRDAKSKKHCQLWQIPQEQSLRRTVPLLDITVRTDTISGSEYDGDVNITVRNDTVCVIDYGEEFTVILLDFNVFNKGL